LPPFITITYPLSFEQTKVSKSYQICVIIVLFFLKSLIAGNAYIDYSKTPTTAKDDSPVKEILCQSIGFI
jgi:hypothetical protein